MRDQDPDRFMITLFFDGDVRADLWTLYAFHHEIAKTREVVTDTHIGLIRLQWWRDAIAAIYDGGAVPHHPITEPLADMIKRRGLNREWFDAVIYAREFDLEDVLPGNLPGLINYADFTQTPLMRLALQITGDDVDAPDVAPVAIGWALSGLIRAVPFHAGQSRCFMPGDLMNRAGLSTDALYAGRDLDKLPAIIATVRDQAHSMIQNLSGNSRLVRLYHAMALSDLARVGKARDNVFRAKLAHRGPFFPLLLWRAARK